MSTEKEYQKLQPLDPEQLWTAWPTATERAARQDESGVVRELTALPGYALDPEHGQRFSHGEPMRWLFRAVAGNQTFESDSRYKDPIRKARELERNLRDLNETTDLKLAREASGLWEHIHTARKRRYVTNVRELGKLIGSREFYVGFENALNQSAQHTFHLGRLEGVAAVQTTQGHRVPQVLISGMNGTLGRKPVNLRTKPFIYEALE